MKHVSELLKPTTRRTKDGTVAKGGMRFRRANEASVSDVIKAARLFTKLADSHCDNVLIAIVEGDADAQK